MESYGPVPSRRLGRSLGINNIPAKKCTYSCVYCQLGRTITMQTKRESFYEPSLVEKTVEKKVENARRNDSKIDYLTFVPDGEPTLEINLGDQIQALRPMGIKIAVISNGSMISQKEVRTALGKADWVSLKADAVTEEVWKKVDRPHKSLILSKILEGSRKFAKEFNGHLSTETMLIDDLNDSKAQVRQVADFLQQLKPDSAYLAIPTRPPAEDWAKPASEEVINRSFQIFNSQLENVEYLIGYEGNEFSFSGDIQKDLLSITSVHPMKEEGVKELLKRASADWDVVERLIAKEKLIRTNFDGENFYIRKLPNL